MKLFLKLLLLAGIGHSSMQAVFDPAKPWSEYTEADIVELMIHINQQRKDLTRPELVVINPNMSAESCGQLYLSHCNMCHPISTTTASDTTGCASTTVVTPTTIIPSVETVSQEVVCTGATTSSYTDYSIPSTPENVTQTIAAAEYYASADTAAQKDSTTILSEIKKDEIIAYATPAQVSQKIPVAVIGTQPSNITPAPSYTNSN